MTPMTRLRILIAVPGILLAAYGIRRLFMQVPHHQLFVLGKWLVGAIIIHDFILSPVIIAVGWLLAHVIPNRARRYVQYALIAGGLVTVVAWPMIHEQYKQPAVKAILRQNFKTNLAVLLLIIAAVCLVLYVVRVARDRQSARPTEPAQSVAGGTSSGS